MIYDFDILLFGNRPKTITLETITEWIASEGARRIHFATSHKRAIYKGADGATWKLKLPFTESFLPIARQKLGSGFNLIESKFGANFWCSIAQEDYAKFESFIEEYKNIVFLRDCLDVSLALSMYDYWNETSDLLLRTQLGEHEYSLKYGCSIEEEEEHYQALLSEMQTRLEQLPFYKNADYICAVPSRRPIMHRLIKGLKGFEFKDVSEHIVWIKKEGEIKNAKSSTEKLQILSSWELGISDDIDFADKNILLVDDMYNSGCTMQYVAMKLKEHGARRVFGLTLVKSMGNK